MSKDYEKNDEAVSPVVGVMLMLVVTIIIAAVVSAFAGGIVGSEKAAPQSTFECHITNDGTWGGSAFDLVCLGTSDAIPTKDLKLSTEWTATDGTKGGEVVTGPLIPDVISGDPTNSTYQNCHYGSYMYHVPLAYGPGVGNWSQYGQYPEEQEFGNYSVMAGTVMHNSAAGYKLAQGGYGVSPDTRYQYTNTGSYGDFSVNTNEGSTDAMQAILGHEWNHLMPGDIVHVKLTHLPSGKLIFDKDVTVG